MSSVSASVFYNDRARQPVSEQAQRRSVSVTAALVGIGVVVIVGIKAKGAIRSLRTFLSFYGHRDHRRSRYNANAGVYITLQTLCLCSSLESRSCHSPYKHFVYFEALGSSL